MEFTAKQIAEMIGGRVEGNADATVNTFAKIEEGKEGAAEEVADARAEGGQSKARDVLVCAERYGQEAVDEGHQTAAEQGAHKRNQDAQERDRFFAEVLVQIAADNAGNAAHIHDAGNPQIQVTALFGQNLAGCTV